MLPVFLALATGDASAAERKWAAIAVPLVAYDSSFGLGLGGAGQVVIADLKGDRPYRASVDAQVYKTTGGFDDHFVGLDLPGAFGSRLRWDLRLRYQRWDRAPYYGIGNDTPRADGERDRYDQWVVERPFALTHLRIPTSSQDLEVYVGAMWAWVSVQPWPNSRLAQERPTGIDGGAVSTLTLGVFRDTRTHEVDPVDGTAIDLAIRAAIPDPVGDYPYAGAHASIRGFLQVGGPVILAGNAVLDGNIGEIPFFEQAYFGGLQRTGIGGRYLLRGLVEERLRGDGLVAGQGEVRFRLGETTILDRLDVRWTLATFADTGWVFEWDQSVEEAGEPHLTGGGGARFTLNDLLVVRVDVGVGIERWEDPPFRRAQPQIYMLAAQPF